MWSYIRNYIIIALGLYGVSTIKYFWQINLSWGIWNISKTTNLFIMYYMERFCAHTKKSLYHVPIVSTNARYTIDLKEKMKVYGLKRDRLYCFMFYIFYNIKNVFAINRYNKRNYIAIILTILFTKRVTLYKLVVNLYQTKNQGGLGALLYELYCFIKRINPNTIKELALIMVAALGIWGLIKGGQLYWNKHIKRVEEVTEEQSLAKPHQESLEVLNTLQNRLGDFVIIIVNRVRELDKVIVQQSFQDYKELAPQILQEIIKCEAIIEEIKAGSSKVEQVKEVEIYGIQQAKYSVHTLALIDLAEEACGKEVLEKYQADIANNEAVYDKEYVAEAREYLHDYLKKCIEYYNELEAYLAKISKSKRRVRKRIYVREQMKDVKRPSEIIKNYFYS